MKQIFVVLAFAVSLVFAEKGDKFTQMTLEQARSSGSCYYACENGSVFLFRGTEKVEIESCLEMRKHRPYNCSGVAGLDGIIKENNEKVRSRANKRNNRK
jgi:hypothetical protein